MYQELLADNLMGSQNESSVVFEDEHIYARIMCEVVMGFIKLNKEIGGKSNTIRQYLLKTMPPAMRKTFIITKIVFA